MKKTVIIAILLVISIFILTNIVYATDINMNLDNNESSSGVRNELYSQDYYDDEAEQNLASSNQNEDKKKEDEDETIGQVANPSTTVASVSTVSGESFGINEILNIFLIVVGVILILLGIAVLIRLK